MRLRDELLLFIKAIGALLPDDMGADTSLIRSGLLDSSALFELALWVEDRVAVDLDLTSFDIAEEWDTLAKLERFIERHRRSAR
jgi:acyl carrier protein